MSRSDRDFPEDIERHGAPSNAELAERTARLEEKIDHISDGVERIEESLADEHEELAEQVQQNEKRVDRFWTIYRFALFVIPLLVGGGGVVGYWALF